jgi:hypothetical protein
MTNPLKHRLRRLATLDLRELVELAEAQLELIAAQLRVRSRPVGRLISATVSDPPMHCGPLDPRADHIAASIRRAANHGVFRPHCLVRAVATNRMLERHGIHGSRIRIGVRPQDEGIIAHAWVEHEGRVIGDTQANVDRYVAMTGVQVVERE